jgi:H3 lysine-79-specific histone-lysine N-methyltransferase
MGVLGRHRPKEQPKIRIEQVVVPPPPPPPRRGPSSNAARTRYQFIHAQQVASLAVGCKALFNATADEVVVEVQYPSLLPRERFELVSGKDMIDAVDTSIQIVRYVADTYLPPDEANALTNSRNGIIRRLEKASNRNVENLADFKAALNDYNSLLEKHVRAGVVARVLDARTELLPPELVAFILEQVYDRTVAPEVDRLAKYENGSDNVYGELLHPLVTRILVEELGLTSGKVFVDLGSGVGNVVLQAALEIGCESWGCEMMDNACDLADKQHDEFATRCMLWGIKPGRVRLERGDFRLNDRIHKALQRADAVLVNNQAFTSQLNDALVSMFLDLKPGCKIVSLKSFVRSSAHSVNDVASSILDVQELTYPEGGQVSWTNAGGSFCISTKR